MAPNVARTMPDSSQGGELAPGVMIWRRYFDEGTQAVLLGEVLGLAGHAPFYQPRMPRSGRPFSVQQTNFGPLGWYSDQSGYRYVERHPFTGAPWPRIPETLNAAWDRLTGFGASPECCLLNLYHVGARMGLHQDRDEQALDAPVLSVSLGDDAVFRIGATTRRSQSRAVLLNSGDVLLFGGIARLAYHGVDRIVPGTCALLPAGGRINLTLRRVTPVPQKQDARPGG